MFHSDILIILADELFIFLQIFNYLKKLISILKYYIIIKYTYNNILLDFKCK